MILLRLVPRDTKINFVGHKRHRGFFAFSGCLAISSILLFLFLGLNFGIDFRGGVLMEVRTEGPADIAEMRSKLGGLGLGDVSIQEFGAPNDVLIRLEEQDGGEPAPQDAPQNVRAPLRPHRPPGAQSRRVQVVRPTLRARLTHHASVAHRPPRRSPG